jgi:hypothetical protein
MLRVQRNSTGQPWSSTGSRRPVSRPKKQLADIHSSLEGDGFELVWVFSCQVVFFGLLRFLFGAKKPFSAPSPAIRFRSARKGSGDDSRNHRGYAPPPTRFTLSLRFDPGFHRSRLPVRDEYRLPRTRRHRCIGVNIAAIYRLETLAALVLNDHAYDQLAAWSNVIPVVPVKGDATEN